MAERALEHEGPVLVFCVSGTRYGTGHNSRARLLTEAIPRRLGLSTTLVAIRSELLKSSARGQRESIDPRALFTYLAKQAHLVDACAVVIDVPWWDPDFSRGNDRRVLNEIGVPVIGVDGPLEDNEAFDLIFLPTFLAPESQMATPTLVRFGWDCFLLRNRASLPRDPVPNSVLVSTGGSDVAELGKVWPSLLGKNLPAGAEVTWVQGPLAAPPELPENSDLNFHVVHNPSNIPELMGNASFGLSVHGVTFFEMLASGIPSVTYSPYGLKDQRELLELQDMKIAEVGLDPEDAVIRLSELMTNPVRARSFSELARMTLSTPGEETFAVELHRILRGVS